MSVKILAWSHIVVAGIVLGGGIAFFGYLLATWDNVSRTDLAWLGPPFLFFAIIFFLPELAGGLGLLGRRAWARGLIMVISVIYLLIFPMGTVLGGFGLWVLFARPTD